MAKISKAHENSTHDHSPGCQGGAPASWTKAVLLESFVWGGGAIELEPNAIMKTPFRGFTAILYKEFLTVLRDPLTLFFMLFPPIVEMIAFGYALDTDVKHITTLVLDQDRTVESRQLVDQFVNTETFRIVGQARSVADLAEGIRRGRAYVGLQIPPGFTRDLRAGRTARVQVLIDGSNSSIASSSLNTSLNVGFRNALVQLAERT